MSKTNRILLGLVIVLVLLVVVLGSVWYFGYDNLSRYYAVYLDSGDIYFGKLSTFPSFVLKDVWYLQRNAQGAGVSVNDFSKSIWGPESEIRINRDKVLWISELSKDSQLIPLLSGQQVYQPQPTSAPTPTSNLKE